MKIRCIIVDDEPLAREGMELLVKEAGFLELRATCSNAIEANRVLAEQEIDLIFLDIQMPRIRGIDFLKSLAVRPLVIITTAFPHYALEGFELNVLDYLLKPITLERFLKAVNRAREAILPENYFFIKTSNGYEKILHEEILFIEANQNYSFIHTPRGKFITLTALGTIEEQLPPAKFLRVHKSYVVSVQQIQGLSGNEITIDKHRVPLSKNYREALMRIIDSRLIRK
ncbi:response regulator [Flavitalea sp. BT771]|uniref:LytR/AlgR family response regulator transcription factor n=1 Tax=Flavitalea sp. BT771 TaxID=3063329 RepID=UPI0026E32EED|nr:response regulator [Flavitalea sp. BT771]MDO6429450.1 response regulator [Flavitalea sp. BT771]MDV6218422.1 response regulator [Flavitalea sp. BT771]